MIIVRTSNEHHQTLFENLNMWCALTV